jgi:hypothetical protein
MAWHARLAFGIFLFVGAYAQAERFPYRAQVLSDAASVRSGPGSRFYVTGQLMQGETVEVYRHVDDQWCAIRPPSTSFSYVRADAVRATENESVIEVIAEDAKTRIGSEVSEARNVEYVRLRKGERLQVLGEPLTFGRSPQLWFKIAPPSGEFRFIHRQEIEASGAETDSRGEPQAERAPADGSSEGSANGWPLTATEASGVESATASTGNPAGSPATVQDAGGNVAQAEVEAAKVSADAHALPIQNHPVQNAAAPVVDGSTVVQASAASTAASSTAGATRAAADGTGTLPLQKLAGRGGQMVTEPIPHAVVPPPTPASAISPYRAGPTDRPDPAPDSLPPTMNAQPTLGSSPSAANPPGTMPPASDRPNGQDGAGSAWSAAEADQPAPPSLQVVDQALGQIATLELELSRIVTQDIGSWRLEELQSRITEVYNRTQDPEVQRSLAHIARRTQEFVDLQRRHQALLASGPAAIPVALPTPSLDPPRAAALAGTAPRDPLASLSEPLTNLGESLRRATSDRLKTATTERPPQSFSGRGWLVPVLTARPDLPRFALTDAQGRILHFVSPSPGINLRRYMRQEVGIVGPSQPGRTGEADRLVADRVVVLNRQQR